MRTVPPALLLAVAVIGCDAPSAPVPPPAPAAPAAPRSSLVSPHSASISGRVIWTGPVLHVDPVTTFRAQPGGPAVPIVRVAPNVPAVDPMGGVGGAVVFLRGIDPAAAHGWDRSPITVELHDERPMIREGDGLLGAIGFVHCGDEVRIVSRQTLFHTLRARGAAFWTVSLPDPDRPRSRRLDRPGVVELSSGANYYWMRGYLWVCEHPYYAMTDASGRWTLSGVPAGEYDLVAWLPDWRTERQERDPETGLVARYVFRPPLEVTRRVAVREAETIAVGDVQINP
jgi:hypothetical protein